jgi:hypothetical protein
MLVVLVHDVTNGGIMITHKYTNAQLYNYTIVLRVFWHVILS